MRLAIESDVPRVVSWTAETFSWGDYVPDRLESWIESPDSEVIVCVDEVDGPVALAHALMLSDTEGWLEGARVHPDHKRRGMGSAMNRAGVEWAKGKGARVVRLATEEDNTAAISQVESLGYRATSHWVYAVFDDVEPKLGEDAAKPAPASDVDAAWVFWSTSDLAYGGRGLLARGWQWRKATPADLQDAAADSSLYQAPGGWAILDRPGEERLRSIWLATTPEDAPRFLDSLLNTAAAEDIGLSLKTPSIPWMNEAITRAGADPNGIVVYSLAV